MSASGKLQMLHDINEYWDVYFTPNAYMKKKFPKAARKKRVRKKWLRRFGPDINFAESFRKALDSPNPFINSFNQDSSAIWHSEHPIDITAMLKDPPNDANL